jgi:ankyrin repeat protein
LMIDNGANPNHKNKFDASPLEFAQKVGDAKLIKILEG